MFFPDRDYWVDAHVSIADESFTTSERRQAFDWCHSLIKNPRPEPNVRNPSDSKMFDMDVYYAWLPGTDIEAHWMVDDEERIVYVVDLGRHSPGSVVNLEPG